MVENFCCDNCENCTSLTFCNKCAYSTDCHYSELLKSCYGCNYSFNCIVSKNLQHSYSCYFCNNLNHSEFCIFTNESSIQTTEIKKYFCFNKPITSERGAEILEFFEEEIGILNFHIRMNKDEHNETFENLMTGSGLKHEPAISSWKRSWQTIPRSFWTKVSKLPEFEKTIAEQITELDLSWL